MDQQPKSDVPAVVARRRRKTARQLRESTPDPSRDGATGDGSASQSQASDDQSGSEGKGSLSSSGGSGVKKSFIERAMDYSSHRNKILARKDKKLATMTPRSRSVPREVEVESVPSSPEIFSLLRRAKKSLTGSRYVTRRTLTRDVTTEFYKLVT